MTNANSSRTDPVDSTTTPVLWISMLLVGTFALAAFAAPQRLSSAGEAAFAFSTSHFGWLYLFATASFIVLLIWLALSRFGEITLGPDDDPPEYGFASWLAMIFSAGMGVGLVFWGVAEPIMHFVAPPHDLASPSSPEAAQLAIQYSVFHWGLHQWANYSIVALTIAYMRFRRRQPALISSAFRPILGDRVDGWMGWSIDVAAVLATSFGVATTLGFGILQMNGGLHEVMGVPIGPGSQLVIIAVITALFLVSASTRLNQGILLLSNLNMWIAMLLAAIVFLAGPTLFILNVGTTAVGDYFSNVLDMSFQMRPWHDSDWASSWTVFYWAWGLSWAPFVGMFIARISRGRTIREFVTGVMLVPAVVSAIWFFIFGGTALHSELFGTGGISAAVDTDTSLALFATLEQLPLGALLALLSVLLILTFLITSADSATFVLGMFTSDGQRNPPRWLRMLWGVLQAGIAGALLYSGGLDALRTVSITAALPFLLLLLLMVLSLLKALFADQHRRDLERASRERVLRELAREANGDALARSVVPAQDTPVAEGNDSAEPSSD
ncbi:MAG: BCCT family transporter [Deltaproteobacteria bacterium]|nr:MAG: BCCT family transporter [Deltaproteobacteria bacterium]